MALTNPNKGVKLAQLSTFKTYLDGLFQTQAIEIEGITAETVEGALEELAGSIAALPSAIVPKGTKTFSQLAPATDLAAANVGFMWNISDAFETTSDFVEGAGKEIPAGANVYVANPSSGVYKYDVFQGMVDLSGYKTKQTAVTDPTAGNTPTLEFIATISQNANGEITATKQTISDVVASVSGAGGSHGLMTAAQAEKLGALPSKGELDTALGLKADKDADAVEGNFAAFDANGNPVDSGHKHSDYQAAGNYKTTQTAVADTDATTSGNAIIFVDSVTQNTNGEITVHKKTVQSAIPSESGVGGQAGLLSAADKEALDNLSTNLDSKADKVASATSGNFAGLDSNGNLTDSGSKASDFKTVQSAVSDPSVPSSGTTEALEFIDSISQNTNGVITPTKKAVKVAVASVSGVGGSNGLMTAAQAEKLDGIDWCSDADIAEIFA